VTDLDPKIITDYHAHVYYDAAQKVAAADLRASAEARFPQATFGRWHDRPVGPHPTGSYQIAFAPTLFPEIVPWLALNRSGLTVFVHPNTGQVMEDHRDRAIWLGPSQALKLSALEKSGSA